MATSLTRRNRRRRKAGTLVAVGAATALLAGGLAPAAPAQAFSLADIPGGCVAGGPNVSLPFGAGTATCEDASPAILAQIGDGLLGIFLPDLPISLGGLNGALGLGFPGIAPGHATIEGTGFNTAIAVGGNATAKSDYYLAGAVALALGGEAHAESLFGLSVAASTIGKANANALPLGIALANSSGLLNRTASATALGGVSAALSTIDFSEQAVCTAVYAQASVSSSNGSNVDSCTSVLFVFQQNQNGSGPVWYAIKNPLDIQLVSPLGDGLAGALSGMIGLLMPNAPDDLADILAGRIIPKFGSDIVRVSFDGGTPKIETDLLDWLGGLVNPSNANLNLRAASAPVGDAPEIQAMVIDELGSAPTLPQNQLSSSTTQSVLDNPIVIQEPGPIAQTEVNPAEPEMSGAAEVTAATGNSSATALE
ncbi:MAG: hypothetical protein WAW85_05620 [Gordonia sp. (in: high G+C Gram-positive bacteria)]|uniref:hypothetical protein n=1 Tax=Gordonia sp. (in: high G+C Gram-positive bacteria) TaxID=84139 RepID=UPI003BB701B9